MTLSKLKRQPPNSTIAIFVDGHVSRESGTTLSQGAAQHPSAPTLLDSVHTPAIQNATVPLWQIITCHRSTVSKLNAYPNAYLEHLKLGLTIPKRVDKRQTKKTALPSANISTLHVYGHNLFLNGRR